MTTSPSRSSPAPRRILVRSVNWLGDAVMTTPALQRLREAQPEARVTLLTHEKLACLWERHPSVDAVLTFSPGESPWSVARRLRAENFQTSVVLPKSFRSALEVWLARIPQRIGYTRPWRDWLLTRTLTPRSEERRMSRRSVSEVRRLTGPAMGAVSAATSRPQDRSAHQIYDYLHLVTSLGANPESLPPKLEVTAAEIQKAEQDLLKGLRQTRADADPGKPLILLGLNPGAEYGPAKRWPAESFAAVAREVYRRHRNYAWLAFGGATDTQLCGDIARLAGGGVVNLAGKTSLRQLMALLKLCRVLLTNDSGPMHVAAALGTPVVVPFGSTSPVLTGPGLPGDTRHQLLQSAAPCSPCFRRVCPIDFRCMTGISHERVVAAVFKRFRTLDSWEGERPREPRLSGRTERVRAREDARPPKLGPLNSLDYSCASVTQVTMRLTRCVAMYVLPLLAGATEIPKPVLPAGVGVNIHFVTGQEEDLDMIAAAGFKFVRMDFHWESIETSKGDYHWAGYEGLLANLDKRGLRAILILDYSHSLYEESVTSPNPIAGKPHQTTASPQHPESIAVFARWAAAAAKHFAGRQVLWEIWNEPNGNFWSPKPNAEQYTALALATAKAMREADPQAVIIGPASSGFPWKFLETFLASGMLVYLDGVSVHPYRNPTKPPESAGSDYAKLRELIDRYAPPSKKDRIPILSGEWGYSTCKRGVTLETQAAFAARQQLVNLLNGVPLSIWYDWKNDGTDPNENEHNFGTVLPNLTPKPAYVAIKTLTRELMGFRIVRRLALPSDKDYALLCEDKAGYQKLAAWTLEEPHTASIEVRLQSGVKPTAVSGNGEVSTPKVESGHLLLDFVAAPQYVPLGMGK